MEDRDQFDDALDSALKRYSDVEPRAGLEGRVLARLAAQPHRVGYRLRWPVIWAGVAAVVMFGMWFALPRNGKPTVSIAREVSLPVSKTPLQPEITRKIQNHTGIRRKLNQHTVSEDGPRIQQFPSPRPTSPEELMLVEYVQRYPKEALLISQEQNEFEEQVQQAERQINERTSVPTER